MFDAISYLVLAGLCASLLGDALTLLPRQRLMYAIGAFFLSHLLYTIYYLHVYRHDAGDGVAGR